MTHARIGWIGFVGAGVVACGAAGCGTAPAAGSRERDSGGAVDAPGAADGGVLDVGIGPWTAPPDAAAPVPLDDVTVYAFSQTGDNQTDPQIIALGPDMSIRTFSRWDTYGTRASDYDFSYVASAHAAGSSSSAARPRPCCSRTSSRARNSPRRRTATSPRGTRPARW